jgi:hypothetical protein
MFRRFERVTDYLGFIHILLSDFCPAGAGDFDFYAHTLELFGTGVEKPSKKDSVVFPSAR